jgi:hypothetical protein
MSRELCKYTENGPYFHKKQPVFQGGGKPALSGQLLAISTCILPG